MTRRFTRTAVLGLTLAFCCQARADLPASSAAVEAGRHRITPHLKIDKPAGSTSIRTGSWWMGMLVMALALGGLGAASIAARRWMPGSVEVQSVIRVVGRTALSPKHSVHLLKTGDRILIVGTGPQGAPSLLGELDDPDEIARLSARPAARGTSASARWISHLSRASGGSQ